MAEDEIECIEEGGTESTGKSDRAASAGIFGTRTGGRCGRLPGGVTPTGG
jgi:hypothetical protein